jgi:hypothetical protein
VLLNATEIRKPLKDSGFFMSVEVHRDLLILTQGVRVRVRSYAPFTLLVRADIQILQNANGLAGVPR